jgi:hypothetical protein
MGEMDKELEKFNTWWERVKDHHHRMSPFQVWDNGFAEGYNAGLQRAIETMKLEKRDKNESTED